MGCKTNHYETDAVAEQFRNAGFEIVAFDQVADVYVLNTCTVTAEADRKSRQFLRRARSLNPHALVVAMGCHVELGTDSDTAFADIIVGTRGKSRVVDQVLARLGNSATSGATEEEKEAAEDIFEEFGAVTQQSETRAYIKIEDGCDSFCTYCAIPFARGRVRSRSSERVIEEARQLAAAGFREIVLTGIHICSYGSERGRASEALPELAAEIGMIKGIERIRFGSLEPQSITPLFVARCAEVKGLCPHFHLSLQSGSDDVLRRMGRSYNKDQFRAAARLVRDLFPTAALTTDVMVGFPGETEAMHRESLDFVREIGFSRLHVFRYSRRAGTVAAEMPAQIEKKTSVRRSGEMQALGQELTLAYHNRLLGQPQKVLTEQIRSDGTVTGYTDTYVPVLIEAASQLQSNQLVDVIPFRCDHEFLYARYASPLDSC